MDDVHMLWQGGKVVVKGYDTYPRGSVLEGQTRIRFLDAYDTVEEAEKAYPQAVMSHRLLEPRNTFNHLGPPDDDDGGLCD
jgi:hypothetical protein